MTQPSLEERLDIVENDIKHIKSAFIKGEYGEPEYTSHRVYHRQVQDSEDAGRKRISDIKTNILTWVAGAIITIVLAQIFQIDPEVLKLLGK